MKKLSETAYSEVRTWIYRNARPLELALWQFDFENGSPERVADMLRFYQNEDGGFGNGVEPDSWNPESSPYATMIVAGMLRGIGLAKQGQPMLEDIFRFLESGVHTSERGWHFGIPSNDRYPRAPWWCYSEELNAVQDMGITAALCALILRYGSGHTALYERACGYVDRILEQVASRENFGEMGAGALGILVQDIEAAGLTGRFECGRVKELLPGLINRTIERNVEKWAEYTPRPSEFIESPESGYYPGNEEVVEAELDYLIDTRNPGGVWNITWTWFDLSEVYPKEFAVSENWWMASKAIEKMRFLRAFGRIERGF